ncbi:MAG: histidine phosphatase family protein [Spirochaetia bacterium]
MARVILVRHGQTEWNRVERFRGRADVPLNETGIAQAEATARRLARQPKPDAVYSSPLSRALVTAQRIAEPHGLEMRTHSGLIDIDYGRWQGLTPEEVAEHWPTELDAWYSSPQTAVIPEGDNLQVVRERAMKTVQDLVRQHGDRSIILVAHTVVNRTILLGVLGLGNERFWRLAQEPCAINTFTVEYGEFTLVCLNDTCHLEDLS